MPLNPINGSDILATAFQKVNANDTFLEGEIGTTNSGLVALQNRVTSIEQDPDVRRFDYDPANSTGLLFAFFGGRYDDLHGESHYVGDGTAAIVAGTNYVELDYDSGVVSANLVGFSDGALKLWTVVSNGTSIVGNPTDFRPQQIQPGVTIGFGFNPVVTNGLNYGYRSGSVRSSTALSTFPGGTVLLTDNAVNYVEIDDLGVVTANTSGWTNGLAPLAEATTLAGVINSVDDSVRGAVITSIGSTGGSGGFFDAPTWMMT